MEQDLRVNQQWDSKMVEIYKLPEDSNVKGEYVASLLKDRGIDDAEPISIRAKGND
jgi:hypothetical protein